MLKMVRAGGLYIYLNIKFYIFYPSRDNLTSKFFLYINKIFYYKKKFRTFQKSEAGGIRESKNLVCSALNQNTDLRCMCT